MSKEMNSIFGFLIGSAIGATLGILFAPDKGSNTRRKIKQEVDSAEEIMAEKALALKQDAKNKMQNSKENINAHLEQMVSKTNHKADEIINILEKKLKDLRIQNNKNLQ